MRTIELAGHKVEIYDAIDMLPIPRFHKYQKYLLVDSGVGSDIQAFDQRVEKARRFMMVGQTDKAIKEFENLRQCVFMIQSELSPRHLAFACLVKSIDGRECGDLSDDGLRGVLDKFKDATEGELTDQLDSVKKKIDGELILYFPSLFADSSVKEYFDLMKKRALMILNNIVKGVDKPGETTEVERLTTELITYSKPESFTGSEGVEVQHDRQFENLCLALSENLNVDPKGYTVLEFYNAFDFLKEKAKKTEKARKRGNFGR